jgi:outer membrane protein TolC
MVHAALQSAVRIGPLLVLALLGGCESICPRVAPTAGALARASSEQPESLPERAPVVALQAPVETEPKVLPISLDTVFRLAQDQNATIRLARLRLSEAEVGEELARKGWLPQIYVGMGYYRHEGGIQDFFGNLIHSSYGSMLAGTEIQGCLDPRDVAFRRVDAERKVWQQRGELSKLTSENLLDAASTYIDLLAARASESLAVTIEKQLTDLLVQANALAKVDKGLQFEVERVEAELRAHRIVVRKLHEGCDSASAKLTYVLGVDPACDMVPIETHLALLNIIDAHAPVQVLVEKSLVDGPGVRELEGLLRLIEKTRAAAQGPGRYMPALALNMNEGAFGAGPGARMAWDNQLNIGLSLRWNITECFTARERQRQSDLQAAQAQVNYQDLRGRLTLGVTEARTAILSGKDQLGLIEEQVRFADKAYELSASRLKESIKGRSPSEVLMAIRTLGGARLEAIQTLRDFDKAQVRLLMLVGGPPAGAKCGP